MSAVIYCFTCRYFNALCDTKACSVNQKCDNIVRFLDQCLNDVFAKKYDSFLFQEISVFRRNLTPPPTFDSLCSNQIIAKKFEVIQLIGKLILKNQIKY